MLKLLGGLLLTGGGLAAGLAVVGELSARLETLTAWTALLGEMERALTYTLPPMPQLLEGLSKGAEGSVKEALTAAQRGLDRLGEHSFAQIWSAALTEHRGALTVEDLPPLLGLGSVLGRWEAEEQRRAIAAARERLEENAARLRQRREREGRVYGTVGLSMGAFLTILLL